MTAFITSGLALRKPFAARRCVRARRRVSPRASSTILPPPTKEVDPAARIPPHVRDFLSRAPGNALQNLLRADDAWEKFRNSHANPTDPPRVVHTYDAQLGATRPTYDVVVCGGTLGIFVATALQRMGRRVAVVEQGPLKGRDQDWNISRDEIFHALRPLGLSDEEIEETIVNEFNPMRVAFTHGDGFSTHVNDVLNIGVSPSLLIDKVRDRFLAEGGSLYDFCRFKAVDVFEDAARVTIVPRRPQTKDATGGAAGAGGSGQFEQGAAASMDEDISFSTKLVIDCMGNFSPIAGQSRRGSWTKPEGVCLVVGSCSDGFTAEAKSELGGDLMVSIDDVDTKRNQQYFWESFPASDGHTTYMFTYATSDPSRASLVDVFDDYLTQLPKYAAEGGIGGASIDSEDFSVSNLEPRRVFFGFFPAYKKHSPLQPAFDRVLHIGDASGLQSPLSFGGFGSLMRHMGRLTVGIDEALAEPSRLRSSKLRLLTPYQPNLAVTWLFQKAMAVPTSGPAMGDSGLISRILCTMFEVMDKHRDPTLMLSFLRDVVQFRPLALSILGMSFKDIALSAKTLALVGPLSLLDWTRHFVALALYDMMSRMAQAIGPAVRPRLADEQRYVFDRLQDGWLYGSGRDVDISSKATQ
eukprot:CAMPEP_0198330896 /NCGR_PEP_ID=MMETSP1450-20131203/17224_1 /TAXON_ID=753684 ORGANISM="Madagascaria erythrocladiodes, Strain CCMP3234" /NCGR_SAMPLE_ID=MMETSP1450 /ASSEMBLY_ACC=CAM_ASM_001115 /LENGTH=637 /DNA_ID=CAMNT_0044035229 /DNA_START=57 /DNA_END=1970 /DNA_ORIENTATION=-